MISVNSAVPTFICMLMERGVKITFGRDEDDRLYMICLGVNDHSTLYFLLDDNVEGYANMIEDIERQLFIACADIKGSG